MSNRGVLHDAKAAFEQWKNAPGGSYVEHVLADAIVRDIVPSLIHLAESGPQPTGFVGEERVVEMTMTNPQEITS